MLHFDHVDCVYHELTYMNEYITLKYFKSCLMTQIWCLHVSLCDLTISDVSSNWNNFHEDEIY